MRDELSMVGANEHDGAIVVSKKAGTTIPTDKLNFNM